MAKKTDSKTAARKEPIGGKRSSATAANKEPIRKR